MASEATETGFLHHLRTCNSARLPGDRVPFRIGSAQVGWVKPALAVALVRFPEIVADAAGITLVDGARLSVIGRQLVDEGHFRWRREEFDIRAEPGGDVLARLDRGALPSFGVVEEGVHVNGLVRRSDGVHV